MTTTDTHETSLFHCHPSARLCADTYEEQGLGVVCNAPAGREERVPRSKKEKKERAPPKEALESVQGEPPDPLSVLGAEWILSVPTRDPWSVTLCTPGLVFLARS